ncbi:hypothetical protein NDI43_07130 [Microcoleus vaginatus GB2-A3]|uniref:hypothetical protein n=1 Tax=Microcoleus vaginatus TaxID=119532 RepID=UPI0032A3DE7B
MNGSQELRIEREICPKNSFKYYGEVLCGACVPYGRGGKIEGGTIALSRTQPPPIPRFLNVS